MDPDVISVRSESAASAADDGTAATAASVSRPKIRVVLADGDPVTRERVREALQATESIVVVAQARDGVEAVELAVYYRPDILLSELRLRQIEGVEAMLRIHSQAPQVHVV